MWWGTAALRSMRGNNPEGNADVVAFLKEANETGKRECGWRSFLFDWLCERQEKTASRWACAQDFARAAAHGKDVHKSAEFIHEAVGNYDLAANLTYLYHAPKKDGAADFFSTRHLVPCIILDGHKPERQEVELVGLRQIMNECATMSQRNALARLTQIWHARCMLENVPIKPRLHSLLVGLSGSGKSWVARQFGRQLNRPLFETSVGRWHLHGGTAHAPATLDVLEGALATSSRLILIDEVDKVSFKDPDNRNYFRGIMDEIMSVLDGTAFARPAIQESLEGSSIIAAGAFQDLYKKRLGEVSFVEEIDAVPPLTFEDIVAAGWLPDELVNRLGTVIELRPPTVPEIDAQMKIIEEAAGFTRPKNQTPEKIAMSMTGIRGLELYALNAAISCIGDF